MTLSYRFLVAFLISAGVVTQASAQEIETLEQALLKEDAERLAVAAMSEGDAERGAVVFHQQRSACSKCHTAGSEDSPLGPDLAKWKETPAPLHLVESILEPSKTIAKEFQAVQILTIEGRLHVGLVAEENDREIKLRDAAKIGTLMSVKKSKIDTQAPSRLSLMPAGVVNGLNDRQQFLDLVKYLAEISRHGPERARELQPSAGQLQSLAEASIDHAEAIGNLPELNVADGRKLYMHYCQNCHGTDGNKTINPLARRFAKDPLRFGTDPYSMWKTISYGNGLMLPQAQLLSPQERYQIVHFLREEFIRDKNPSQYFKHDDEYLAKVNARAAIDAKEYGELTAVPIEPGMIDGSMGQNMDYGPYLCHSVSFVDSNDKNADRFEKTTERALIVDLPGDGVICYDVDQFSVSGIWEGTIANTAKTHHTSYKGSYCLTPGGQVKYTNTDDPGWRIDASAGNRPAAPIAFRGHYLHGNQVLMRFDVAGRRVEELPSAAPGETTAYARTIRVASGEEPLLCLVARLPEAAAEIDNHKAELRSGKQTLWARISGATEGMRFEADESGGLWVSVPAAKESRSFTIWFGEEQHAEIDALAGLATPDLDLLSAGGPRRWPQIVHTTATLGEPVEGYAADEITVPYGNPWGSWMRTTAFDFFSDGRVAASTLSGDVFIVTFDPDNLSEVAWSRFATGLYEPLGLKIVDDLIYVRGRDRITRLRDLNNDGEADYYETFHQEGEIGPGYHAFLFDLQTDREGNFYFARSGRKAPHEGGVIRISPDGKRSEIVSRDFRHPNGMGAGGPHDWITVSDNPDGVAVFNGVSLVREGALHGYSRQRSIPMLTVLPASVDSSSAGQCWADPQRWGPLSGTMIHTSYSRGAAFYIMTQDVGEHPNGFAVRLPWDFKTGVMRPRSSPIDGQVYVIGQKGWDTAVRYDGCLYRLRYTGEECHFISKVAANERGLRITFASEIDPQSVSAQNVEVVREENKGVKLFKMGGVRVIDDRTIEVELPEIGGEVVAQRSGTDAKTGDTIVEVRGAIRVNVKLRAADGAAIDQTVYATVNSLP